MQTLELAPGNSLAYEYQPPTKPSGVTFVFFNALTGSADMWRGGIGDSLTAEGHGLLLYNMRGQAETAFTDDCPLDMGVAVNDAIALLRHVGPRRPVFVGLSIGGLFAARAHLGGASCVGLALLNTLRADGPRLAWINAAVTRAAELGGPALVMDLYAPLLFSPRWLAANRDGALNPDNHQPIDQTGGVYRLLASGGSATWDVPWESVEVPTLVLTGLQDRLFYDADDVSTLCGRLPDALRVDLSDSGHMIPIERPDALCAELLALATRAVAGE